MSDHVTRVAAVRQAVLERGLDAMVVEQPTNRRYLSGFSGSSGIAVVSADDAWLITDSRYYGRATAEAPEFRLVKAGLAMLEHLAQTLAGAGARRVGLEADFVTLEYHDRLAAKVEGVEWVPTTGVIGGLRACKDAGELDRIARAAALTDAAMAHAYAVAAPGMTERELAWALEVFVRERGADGPAFEFIVAGGPNGALPHHEPGHRPLVAGEPVVVDIGARLDGYCSDLTRTFCLGEPADPDYLAAWEVVAEANKVATAHVRPGVTGREADAAGRDVVAAAGYGDAFGHGLGHGVGLDIHELPRLGPAVDNLSLAANMVITIEPGIYLEGRFGVRIEDLVVIRESGAELLSRAAKVAQVPVRR
jgi:Xaa-Pro aminopeptidase